MQITVYSPPEDCFYCGRVKHRLIKEGIPFEAFVASEDQVTGWTAEGLKSYPVVVVNLGDGASWTFNGYDIDALRRLKQLHREIQDSMPLAA